MTIQPLRIFIGYDSNEITACHTLIQSVLAHASVPVAFTPVALSGLNGIFARERNNLQSTEFSFSRFLTPYLSGYEGWSLFVDCDILFRDDVAKLFAMKDEQASVMVCQHDYTPSSEVKFLNHIQTVYAKKNWSSVMLFNNARCRSLTPDYVNTASGLELHQFKWLASEDEIGALPLDWNWLVGEYAHKADAKAVHFTLGGPYFTEFADCDYAAEWRAALAQVQSVRQRDERS
jgi:lipopolysaccharide biosynthesis glycosyltransferase